MLFISMYVYVSKQNVRIPLRKAMDHFPLLSSVAIWCAIAFFALISIITILSVIRKTNLFDLIYTISGYNLIKLSFASVGGLGAVACLVLTYQKGKETRYSAMRDEARLNNEKISHAIQQLASKEEIERLAGVYALENVANQQAEAQVTVDFCNYRQLTVDLLCNYLCTNRNHDKIVERAILSIFKKHLAKPNCYKPWVPRNDEYYYYLHDSMLWIDCTFNLQGASFTEDVDFSECYLGAAFDFSFASFSGKVDFSKAVFYGNNKTFFQSHFNDIDFSDAEFHEDMKEKINFGDIPLSENGLPKGAKWHDKGKISLSKRA